MWGYATSTIWHLKIHWCVLVRYCGSKLSDKSIVNVIENAFIDPVILLECSFLNGFDKRNIIEVVYIVT